ncbi:MAG: methyltransferase domain-containing protein [Bacteroidetes bacterium]|nr:MAG: methyltransferase domain-containing protein [Bacteroidota bacterium]
MNASLPLETLEARVCARYETERLQLMLGEQVFGLRVIRNLDALLDELLARGEEDPAVQDEQIPYWADLWPSAIALGRHILNDDRIGPGTRVLELGCGLGLSGTVAGYKGAEVILSDYLPEALELAELTWRLNLEQPPRLERLDWREPRPELAADVLLASDVAYETRAHGPLEAAFRQLLRPEGYLLLSEPGRPQDHAWLQSLPNKGFHIHTQTESVCFRNHPYTIYLHEIRLI